MTFEVGDSVLVSDNAWVDEPGGFVDPDFFGKIGTVHDAHDEWVVVSLKGRERYVQWIHPSCLTLVEE